MLPRPPLDNCQGGGVIVDPQSIFANYLTHKSATAFVDGYRQAAALTTAKGKPIVMLETNTASCGGFKGISDSFGAAMWGLDISLQLAAANFSQALFHVGGQNDYYNVRILFVCLFVLEGGLVGF